MLSLSCSQGASVGEPRVAAHEDEARARERERERALARLEALAVGAPDAR